METVLEIVNPVKPQPAFKKFPRFTRDQAYKDSLEYFNGDDLAASTFIGKYALKNPLDNSTPYVENTPHEMHVRIAKEFYIIENRYKNGLSFQQIFDAIASFKHIVPQGSPMYGIGNPYVNVSLSNCVVIDSPVDSLTGILNTSRDLANLMKRRCGVGIDISTLRPDNAPVTNSAGTSTGAWSFADLFSYVTRMVAQRGRRGALMITMDIKHPDIEQFVTMKHDLKKVTGANISIMLGDEFMKAVQEDRDWICRWPVDKNPEDASFTKTFKAKKLWRTINDSATKTAEPGLLFWDNYCNNLPAHCYPDFKSISVNPCAELALSKSDSCRLMSINLKNFVDNPFTEKASFNFHNFKQHVRIAMRLMDDLVDLEIDHLSRVIDIVTEEEEKKLWSDLRESAVKGRRTGLGTHGLADMLACLTLSYDSDKAQDIVRHVYRTLRDSSYFESLNLAKERGAFPVFNWETEKDCAFIKRLPLTLRDEMSKHGRRNISILTNAPTGSVSIVSQTSSGIEPVFMNFYMRRKKVNLSDPSAKIDFTDQNGDNWEEFMVFHPNVKQYLESQPEAKEKWEQIQRDFPKAKWSDELDSILPKYFITAPQIECEKRVELQGIAQEYIDHGISSTLNLPKGTPVETVEKIYEKAWKHGLKGVTVYVDGSRSGVLVSAAEKASTSIVDSTAPKRPVTLPCDIHHSTIDGQKWTILVGLLEGRPYEMFGGLAQNIEIPKKYESGTIVKHKCEKVNAKGRHSCYDLIIGEGEDAWTVKDISITFDNESYATQTRHISLSLRHGVPVHFVCDQLGSDKQSEMHSFSRVMARVLKKYVKDGANSSESCEKCGQKMVFSEGCATCMQCGESKCS